jgi:hypothetical protein
MTAAINTRARRIQSTNCLVPWMIGITIPFNSIYEVSRLRADTVLSFINGTTSISLINEAISVMALAG